MLRSQDGVENVENPYGNLQHGQIEIKAASDKTIDLARLVQILEKEIGFEPVTRVTVKIRGHIERRGTRLVFTAARTGQSFEVDRVEEQTPPEQQLIAIVATLVNPQTANQIVLQEWKRVEEHKP